MPPGYHIEAFSLDRYRDMQRLYASAFHAPLSLHDFRKKYTTLGHEVIGYLAMHEATGTPAAFYGVFPVTVIVGENELQAAQSGDTMTHADHRKKGLFIELAQQCFETCRQQGIAFVFGLPNENSYPGFINKLNWKQVNDIDRFQCKLRIKTFPWPKLFARLGIFSFYLKWAKLLLRNKSAGDPDHFFNPLHTKLAKIKRDAAYLQYKKGADKYFIRIGNARAWIKLTDVLLIGDFDNYDAVDEKVLSQLKRLCFLLGYNTMVFYINRNVAKPLFLQQFRQRSSWPSCFCYLDPQWEGIDLLLTAADFDTW